MKRMMHVQNFSGGLCSFWSAVRVAEKHGTSDLTLLFADTLIEDEELYEFNERAAQYLGVPITRISLGVTPWELFRSQGLIGNSRFPICSIYLKREPLDEWHAAHCVSATEEQQESLFDINDKRPATIYVGFDWTEENRLKDLRAERPDWRIEAPMCDSPLWDKCQMEREARAIGMPIPRLYGLGFPHNNCGGRCVRAGISHWVHLYHVLPSRYLEWEVEEQSTKVELERRGIKPFSILKDRRGGFYKPLWLADLRIRIQSGEKFDKYDWGGCGCGGATQEQNAIVSITEQ
jgi:hypothetical protein